MIRPIKPKDNLDFVDYCLYKEYKTDARELQCLFNDTQKRGIECTIYDDKGFQGLLLVIKENDRKYIHLIVNNNIIALQLIKQYIWNSKNNLYIKFPKWNALVNLLNRLGFRITSKRGDSTVDLCRKFDKKFYFPKKKDKKL